MSNENGPDLSYLHAQKALTIAGVRPFRKGGLRVQKETIGSKIVIHNYGHGGAGISLAPQTAVEALEILLKQEPFLSLPKVAVLGSGIVGLFTALEASELGFDVTVYAKRIPQPNSTDSLSMCTSEVPPGYWLPYSYQFQDPEQHSLRSMRSFAKYMKLGQKYQSLSTVEVYESANFRKQKMPDFLVRQCRQTTSCVNNHEFKHLYFQTIQINLQTFLQQLLKECRQQGVKFVSREFNSQADLLDLQQSYLFNCMAFGSKRIFNDSNMYGVKGHLLRFENKSYRKWGIYNFENLVKFYFLPDKILVGLTSHDEEEPGVNPQAEKQLKAKLQKFMQLISSPQRPSL